VDKKIYKTQRIRRVILMTLHEARLAGASESEGWLNNLTLRRILADQGYDMSDLELRDALIWLLDRRVDCIEMERVGKKPPYIDRSRITSVGVSVAIGERDIEGIASE
jgi:hypothetical protein